MQLEDRLQKQPSHATGTYICIATTSAEAHAQKASVVTLSSPVDREHGSQTTHKKCRSVRLTHVFAFARCLTPQSHIPPCISDKYADRSCRNSAFSDLDMLLPMVLALQCDFLFLDYGACCLRVPSEDRWIFPRALHMLHHEFHLGFNIDRSSRCVLRISRRRLFKLENGAQFLCCKLHDYRCHTANYARSCWRHWYSITSHLLILSAKQN